MLSKIEEAYTMCIELGKILCQTEEYKAMRKCEYDLLKDKEARDLVESLQEKQEEFRRKNMSGVPISEADRQLMKDLEEKAMKNEVVKNSHTSHERFQELMKKVSGKIREGIRQGSQPKH